MRATRIPATSYEARREAPRAGDAAFTPLAALSGGLASSGICIADLQRLMMRNLVLDRFSAVRPGHLDVPAGLGLGTLAGGQRGGESYGHDTSGAGLIRPGDGQRSVWTQAMVQGDNDA